MNRQFPEIIFSIAEAMRGQGGRALLVGGIVRDMLLGLPPKDYDFEVYGIAFEHLEVMIRFLNPDWMGTVGKAFCVLKVRFGELAMDIAIPRRESKSGAGHDGFRMVGDPTMSPQEGARRRDFTVNAMALDPLTDEIFDFFGGREDLSRKILRATDPKRFCDDPLRVLRAVQFAGRFGFSVEPHTIAVCREMTREDEFRDLPAARIGEEWRKLLLKSQSPSVGLEVGRATGAFEVLHPELTNLIGVPQDAEWHPEGDVWTHTCMVADAARGHCPAGRPDGRRRARSHVRRPMP